MEFRGDNMEKAVDDALASYTGDELRIGVLSASIDTPRLCAESMIPVKRRG